MNIDTLLRLLSGSFNIFKTTIKTIAPSIILFGLILPILILQALPEDSNIGIELFLSFTLILYQVILLKYIFTHIKNINQTVFNISEILILSIKLFCLNFIVSIPYLITQKFIPSLNLFALLLLLISSFLLSFVIYIMIDKNKSLKNSIIYSSVLAINNIRAILLFYLFSFLLLVISLFIALIIISFFIQIHSMVGVLLAATLGATFYYMALILFASFYIMLSNKK